ncbi:MAG TPA: histidine phosphatase family protein [Blastocatellia bacterium]|nr:histidine phosphatase family protein [Blastocatellia bacterium]
MKTLLLMRHAKSDWGDTSLRDFDRPLAERGERDAPRMARALKERGPLPDLIISSPAARARQTSEAVIASAGLGASLEFEGSIYEASTAELMKVVRGIPDASGCAMMVGHNPGFEGLVARLSGAGERMPTAAIACIEFDVDGWEDVEDGRGRLKWLMTPRSLP